MSTPEENIEAIVQAAIENKLAAATAATNAATNAATAAASKIETDASVATSWLKIHETLIISVLLIVTGAFISYKYISYRSSVDTLKAQQAQITLTEQKKVDAQLTAQAQETALQYRAMVDSLSAQNASLAASVSRRDENLSVRETKDKALPLPELAVRWSVLGGFDSSNLTATTSGIAATPEAAVITVQKLEQIPVLTNNLKDVQDEKANVDKELAEADKLIGNQTSEIGGLNKQMVDVNKACSTEITAVKAQARKSKFHWFGVGYVAGLVSGILLIHGA